MLTMRGFLFLCVIFSAITIELLGLKCDFGTFYKVRKKDGRERCKRCPDCNAGNGWNTSVAIKTDEVRGFLECYPCERCPVGYYRQANSHYKTCYECRLDCKRLNRYGSVQCGFDNPGHCGECFPGFRPESSEPNDICRREVTTYKAVSPFEQVTWQQSHQTLDSGQIVLICLGIAFCLIVLAAITAFLLHRCKMCKTYMPSPGETLWSSVTPLAPKFDCEVDGPTPVPAGLDTEFNKEKKALIRPCRNAYHPLIVDRIIEKDDETLSVIATRISGKTVKDLFGYLQVHKSKIDPQEELFEKQVISYQEYVLKVLIEWTKSAHPNSTLKSMCQALEKASFLEVIDDILALEENQPNRLCTV